MRQRKFEIIIGISIIVATILFVFGYIFIREIPVNQKGFEVTMLFDNVTGLTNGDPIRVSGVKVGRVKDMRLEKDHVAVRVWLDGNVPFSRDSHAAIKSIGMIGEKYIALLPGTADNSLQSGDTILGVYSSDLADVSQPISELISQATAILTKLNTSVDETFLQQARNDALISLHNIKNMSSELETNFNGNVRSMEKTITNLDTMTSTMTALWKNNNADMDNTFKQVSLTASQLPALVARLDSALTTTQFLLAKVENAEGSVGKAVVDDELYTKAQDAINQVQVLLADIKKRPNRYFSASFIDLF
jgi:phospholipid/cholesterol/gamma-HCH transport system substrate-binding protein